MDLGFDTPDGMNVKAIEHPTHRLVVTPGKLGKAKRFVLVYVDLPNRLATILAPRAANRSKPRLRKTWGTVPDTRCGRRS